MKTALARCLIGVLACCAWLRAVGEVREMQMRFLGVEDGLSHQTVNCFCQDEFGFIWIGTADGLNRYDGRSVDCFRPDGKPWSISSNNILQLFCDRSGYLYLRSNNCVERYDQRLKRFEVLYEGDIQAMSLDSTHLYLIDRNRILRRENRQGASTPFETIFACNDASLPSDDLGKLVLTDRSLVVSSATMGLIEIVDGKIVHREDLRRVYSLSYDEDGYLWVTTRGDGLYRFDAEWNLTHYKHIEGDASSLLHNNVRSIVRVAEGRYYVGSLGGLQQFDIVSGCFTPCHYELASNLKMRSIFSMFVDDNGTLWLGTFHGGVHYYDHTNEAYRFYHSMSVNRHTSRLPLVGAIVEDNDGNIWLGSEGSGLIRFSPQNEKFTLLGQLGTDEVVKALYFDADRNELWASTITRGVFRLALNTGRVDHIPPEVVDVFTGKTVAKLYNPIRMIEDGRGNLLLGTSEGLVRLDRRQMRLEAIDNEAIFRRNVSQVWDMVREGDRLWIATSFDLICLMWESGKVDYYSFADITGRNTKQYISHLHLDRKGRLWLGSTGSGVYRYRPEQNTFEAVGSSRSLANGYITAMAEGGDGSTLYIADSHGLCAINDNRVVDQYTLTNNFSLTSVCYHGLFVSRNNDLYICGPQGMIRAQRRQFDKRASDYKVYIKDVWVDDQPVMPRDSSGLMEASALYQQQMVLPSRHSSITFCFAHNNYRNFPVTELEYCLEGFDSAFRKADGSTSATYMNLAPGRYRFVVRGERAEQSKSTPEATFELRVRAPLYAQTWFQFALFLLVLGVGWRFYRIHLHRQQLEQMLRYEQREKEHLEQINTQKLRFFTNISHEFRTPLTLIAGQIELLLARKDMQAPIYNKVLSIYRNTHRMKQMVDEIIDFRRFDQTSLRLAVCRENLTDVAKDVWLSFYDFSVQHRIDFRFEAPRKAIEAEFDRKQIERVLNNLLSNAFKYTPEGGSITVTLTADATRASIAVADTGVGIDAKHLSHIFDRFWQEEQTNAVVTQQGSGIGLSLAKNLVEMHDGTIGVESTPGKGSRFEVSLPLVMRRDNPYAGFVEADLGLSDCLPSPNEYVAIPEEFEKERPHLLIVEDNEEMRELLRQLFESAYRVSLAANGAEGLERARREQPDLVLSDVMMPVMSGFELCRSLKTDFETSHIPVVLLTAYNAEEHTLEGLSVGADDYVAKPFNSSVLLARCNNIVVQRRRLQARFGETADVEEVQAMSNSQDAKFLSDVVAIIESRLADPKFNINALASTLGLSRTLLFAKLKGVTGQTPNDFILSCRFNKARKLLVEIPSATVAEIAYDLGFSTPSYFISRFRARYGITPNAYRKQCSD